MDHSDSPAWGAGLATVTTDGQMLDVWFPLGSLGLGPADGAGIAGDAGLVAMVGARGLTGMSTDVVQAHIESLADPPKDLPDAYLRLHLLSYRLVQPHEANLEGIFALLPTVAWTSAGPCPPNQVGELRLTERSASRVLTVYGVDKFPRMTDYVVPDGVRIADADRVRLGAHLGSGTVVMHEGFVNFNAGTIGGSMVEGRVSAGVVVGEGSDIGGGASIMGTLSGGGAEVVRIGERCLIGANAGVGISLGDDCVVEAGCYVTAGSKVKLPDGSVVKARALSGSSNLLFWRHSVTGALEVRDRSGAGVALNPALHAHN